MVVENVTDGSNAFLAIYIPFDRFKFSNQGGFT